MRCKLLVGMMLSLLFCGQAGLLWADEADELHERAKQAERISKELAKQGEREHAERFAQEAAKLQDAAKRAAVAAHAKQAKPVERTGIEQEMKSLHARLEQLHSEERKLSKSDASEQVIDKVREQIAITQREIARLKTRFSERGSEQANPESLQSEPAKQIAAASRRIQHLRVAAENLKQAEMPDLAQKVLEQAEAMERELQIAKQHLAAEMKAAHHKPVQPGADVVRELKEELQRLHDEVQQLHQKIDQR